MLKLNWFVLNILMVSHGWFVFGLFAFLVPLDFVRPYAYYNLFTANSAPREYQPKIRKGKERVRGSA